MLSTFLAQSKFMLIAAAPGVRTTCVQPRCRPMLHIATDYPSRPDVAYRGPPPSCRSFQETRRRSDDRPPNVVPPFLFLLSTTGCSIERGIQFEDHASKLSRVGVTNTSPLADNSRIRAQSAFVPASVRPTSALRYKRSKWPTGYAPPPGSPEHALCRASGDQARQ